MTLVAVFSPVFFFFFIPENPFAFNPCFCQQNKIILSYLLCKDKIKSYVFCGKMSMIIPWYVQFFIALAQNIVLRPVDQSGSKKSVNLLQIFFHAPAVLAADRGLRFPCVPFSRHVVSSNICMPSAYCAEENADRRNKHDDCTDQIQDNGNTGARIHPEQDFKPAQRHGADRQHSVDASRSGAWYKAEERQADKKSPDIGFLNRVCFQASALLCSGTRCLLFLYCFSSYHIRFHFSRCRFAIFPAQSAICERENAPGGFSFFRIVNPVRFRYNI